MPIPSWRRQQKFAWILAIKNFAIISPPQPLLGRHLRFRKFFSCCLFLHGLHLFLQFGCFCVDTLVVIADAPLSRLPLEFLASAVVLCQQEEYPIESCVAMLPASTHQLNRFCQAQANDPAYSNLIDYCKHGWPFKREVAIKLKPYRGDLTLHNNLLLCRPRIVAQSLQREALSKATRAYRCVAFQRTS